MQGFDDYKDVFPTVQRLVDKGYVLQFGTNNYNIRLTDEGCQAAEVGVIAYNEQKSEAGNLVRQNLELQNEALQYQKKLRAQDEEIKRLTAANLQLQNRNLRRTEHPIAESSHI